LWPFGLFIINIASRLKPFDHRELEITDLNKVYLQQGTLRVEILGRGFVWLDNRTHESLLEASTFIETIEKGQGLKIACLEEIPYRMGYINAEQGRRLARPLQKSGYGRYLLQMIAD
jgi:glucose-1-phosphate thymidylyltransferase